MKKLKKILHYSSLLSLISMATIVSASNDFFKMKVGEITVMSFLDTSFEFQSSLFKTGDSATIQKYMPDGKLPGTVNVFLIKNSKQTILVDAGFGHSNSLVNKLKKIGVQPEKVDLVLITHGHFDHVGALVSEGNAVFPNANVLISEKEKLIYEDGAIAMLPAENKPFFMPANEMLKVYGNKVVTFVPGKQVAEGMASVDLNGHTAGHTGYMVESKGQKLLIAGDILHVPAVQFPHPEFSLVYDSDVDLASKMRSSILERAITEKIILAGVHLTFPGIGQVSKDTEGFVFTVVK